MTARRRRRSEQAGHADASAAVARPTPETVTKLRRDLIAHLYVGGRLRREHVDAAEDIRLIWYAFTRRLGPSAVDFTALATGPRRGPGAVHQPIEWLTGREERIWRNRYRPWAAEMAQIPAGGTVSVTRFRLVLDLAVENESLRRVEAWYRIRHGRAFEALRDGLQRYAEIAGWIEPPSGPASIG